MAIRPSSLPALSVAMAFAGGCMSSSTHQVLAHGTDAEIQAAALRAAKADIASGHLRICHAGTWGASAVGASEDMMYLPAYPLPCGCTDPLALPAIKFAEVYNTKIAQYLHDKDAAK